MAGVFLSSEKVNINSAYRYADSPTQMGSGRDSDDFLSIMTASLKSSSLQGGMNSSEFASSMSQYASMKSTEELTESMKSLTATQEQSALINNLNGASALIGKTVTAGDVTGTVESVTANAGKVQLVIGGKGYDVSSVTQVLASMPHNSTADDTVVNLSADNGEYDEIKLFAGGSDYVQYLNSDNGDDIVSLSAANSVTTPIPAVELAVNGGLTSTGWSDSAMPRRTTTAATTYTQPTQYTQSSSMSVPTQSQLTSAGVTQQQYNDYLQKCQTYAAQVNTKMADVRWIFNSSVNSEIDTKNILGVAGGKAYTDIGFSGKGKLGEVVTWADGTQRVEVISPYGYSTWLTTTGNYTLDELCNYNLRNGELAGKLTGQEIAVRYFSKVYTDAEKSAMAKFENYMRTIPLN